MKAKERRKKPYRVRTIIQTSICCPSQWEGHLKDGKMFYVRYRWGILTVYISNAHTKNVKDCFNGQEVINKRLGDEFACLLGETKLIEILKRYNFKFDKNFKS